MAAIIGFDSKSNLSNRQFSQGTGDTLNLYGQTIIGGACGVINSANGYQISGVTIFNKGKNSCTSIQIGKDSLSDGFFSNVIGYNSYTTGNTSILIGNNSYIHHDCSIIVGNTSNCTSAICSNIFGGSNNCLGVSNVGSTLLGVNNTDLSAGSYVNTVIIPNLAILNTPSGSGNILCWNSGTKMVGVTTGGGGSAGITGATSLGTGNAVYTSVANCNLKFKSLCAYNGLSATTSTNNVCFKLGGVLTETTQITSTNYDIGITMICGTVNSNLCFTNTGAQLITQSTGISVLGQYGTNSGILQMESRKLNNSCYSCF